MHVINTAILLDVPNDDSIVLLKLKKKLFACSQILLCWNLQMTYLTDGIACDLPGKGKEESMLNIASLWFIAWMTVLHAALMHFVCVQYKNHCMPYYICDIFKLDVDTWGISNKIRLIHSNIKVIPQEIWHILQKRCQMHFGKCKYFYFYSHFTGVCS